MTVGERIRQAREARGMTQQALSDKVGVSRGMIAQIERDTKQVTVNLCKEIARALDCTLEQLAG